MSTLRISPDQFLAICRTGNIPSKYTKICIDGDITIPPSIKSLPPYPLEVLGDFHATQLQYFNGIVHGDATFVAPVRSDAIGSLYIDHHLGLKSISPTSEFLRSLQVSGGKLETFNASVLGAGTLGNLPELTTIGPNAAFGSLNLTSTSVSSLQGHIKQELVLQYNPNLTELGSGFSIGECNEPTISTFSTPLKKLSNCNLNGFVTVDVVELEEVTNECKIHSISVKSAQNLKIFNGHVDSCLEIADAPLLTALDLPSEPIKVTLTNTGISSLSGDYSSLYLADNCNLDRIENLSVKHEFAISGPTLVYFQGTVGGNADFLQTSNLAEITPSSRFYRDLNLINTKITYFDSFVGGSSNLSDNKLLSELRPNSGFENGANFQGSPIATSEAYLNGRIQFDQCPIFLNLPESTATIEEAGCIVKPKLTKLRPSAPMELF